MNEPSGSYFRAQAVGVEEAHDLGTLIVGFAESPDGSGISLSFQSDLDDAPNRTDDYSISNELGATVYGGVTRYELEPHRLTVELDDEAASVLHVDSPIVIDFDVDQATWMSLKSSLDEVLRLTPERQ